MRDMYLKMLCQSFFVMLTFPVVLAVPVWILWNWLMPVIFGLGGVTLFQAWGLLMLSSFLVKGTSYAVNNIHMEVKDQ